MRMNIDTGLAVVIIAVLVFYLRLIIIQRQRAKRVAQAKKSSQAERKKARNNWRLPNLNTPSSVRTIWIGGLPSLVCCSWF